MKAWGAALALVAAASAAAAAVVFAVHVSATAQAGQTSALILAARAELASKARVAAPTSPPAPAAQVAPAAAGAPGKLRFRQTNTYSGGIVYVPETCQGAHDVVLHFHGAHNYVVELAEKANLDAVLAVFNVGNGAERYSQVFQAEGMLSSLLRQIERAAARHCGGHPAAPQRVALSAWSAGYAAVEKLIARPADLARVDAVLLADGLHAALLDRRKRSFAPNALEAFVAFGRPAITGNKLLAITHSTIETPSYGSTTECSRLLLERLNVPPQGEWTSGSSGSFSIQGSGGADKAAHIAQFRTMDESLLSKLRDRWAH